MPVSKLKYSAFTDEVARKSSTLVWTISGGHEYLSQMGSILRKWESLGMTPLCVIALDNITSNQACEEHFFSALYDIPYQTYSHVADAKFVVASLFASMGLNSFFIEMDVFCRQNPISFFSNIRVDLSTAGHAEFEHSANIGLFYATTKMSSFFDALLLVLANGKKNNNLYWDSSGKSRKFFDQAVYQSCLPYVQNALFPNHGLDYMYVTPSLVKDYLDICRPFQNFSHSYVSSHIISCSFPPIISDDTICIHPLAGAPFTPFTFKLATAKFLGFDPEPYGKSELFLKLASGDIEFSKCSMKAFEAKDFYTNSKMVMDTISFLVEMAYRSNRTLFLPKYVRARGHRLIATHSVLDLRTIGVKYRFYSSMDSNLLLKDTAIFQLEMLESSPIEELLKSKVRNVAITNLCCLNASSFLSAVTTPVTLGWCIERKIDWSGSPLSWRNFCRALK